MPLDHVRSYQLSVNMFWEISLWTCGRFFPIQEIHPRRSQFRVCILGFGSLYTPYRTPLPRVLDAKIIQHTHSAAGCILFAVNNDRHCKPRPM